jgi:penicillin-binding protein 1C
MVVKTIPSALVRKPASGASVLHKPISLLAAIVVLLLSGCSAPDTLAVQLRSVPPAAAQSIVTHYLRKYNANFQLEPRQRGGTREIAEAYLRRYQPGPEPRVFQSSVVYDRRNRVMAELFDEGRRTWVPLSRISPSLLDAVVATEDGSFFQNEGIDTRRLVGAFIQNTQNTSVVAGASTITMQLARMLFLPPDERFSRSLDRKINEVQLAQDLTRLYSKDEILELYLNLAYFGHLAYGPEAAARTYFGKTAAELSLAEASLLAGLPQQPAFLDPFVNLEAAKARQQIVLDLMVRRGYISQVEADVAFGEPVTLAADPNDRPYLAPHFLQYLAEYVARSPENSDLLRSGLTVYSTLDLDMQNLGQQVVRETVDALRPSYNLNNAALIALKPGTSEILVMVGSADYENDAIGGQVNVALRLRQPGSAIKPVVYATALDKGLISPATLLWDLPVKYPTADKGREYRPENYDKRFRGPVTVRTALANSLNVPTIKLFDGIEPSEFITTANNLGISSFDPQKMEQYGLSTALGGTEVSLYDLTAAYQTLANGGHFVEPTPVRQVVTSDGVRLEIPPQRPPVQAVSPETAFLVTDMISDNAARAPIFGENSRLKLSRPAAAKTGTTTNFRDNWTVGFTKYLVAGVWAGNNDGRPMRNADGITGAGPIWNKFMEAVLADPVMLEKLNAPAEVEAWTFAAPVGVSQVARTCPPELRCRDGGEYFSQRWLEHMAAAGPYADSFLSGIMAPVNVQLANGQTIRPAVCVMRLTAPDDLQARSTLVLPRGVGRLSMQWQSATVAGSGGATTAADPAAVGSIATKLASASITAPIRAPALAPRQLGQAANQTATQSAGEQPAGAVVVDSSVAPLLLLDLPYTAADNQPIGSPGSELELDPSQRLVLATNDRLRDEQIEVTRWARNNGRSLVWGDCGHAFEWAVALYGNGVRNVTVGVPIGPETFVAVDDGVAAREPEAAPTPEPAIAASGSNGIYSPVGGTTVAGTVAVQGAASLPDFWKWQLDVLVGGQNASFIAVGEQPVPAPTPLVAWNTANYPNGEHVLRLRVVHRDGNYDEYYTRVTIAN